MIDDTHEDRCYSYLVKSIERHLDRTRSARNLKGVTDKLMPESAGNSKGKGGGHRAPP